MLALLDDRPFGDDVPPGSAGAEPPPRIGRVYRRPSALEQARHEPATGPRDAFNAESPGLRLTDRVQVGRLSTYRQCAMRAIARIRHEGSKVS